MSPGLVSPIGAYFSDLAATSSGKSAPEDVVEIGLLVPAEWAVGLMELAKKRRESVGQLLRGLIGRELAGNDTDVNDPSR